MYNPIYETTNHREKMLLYKHLNKSTPPDNPIITDTTIGQTIDQNNIWNIRLVKDFNFQWIPKYPEIRIKQFTQTKLILRNSRLNNVPNESLANVSLVGNIRDGI